MQISIDSSVSNANDHLITSKPIQSSEFYEAAIIADETIISNYWYLGVSYLQSDREEEAQAAWIVPFSTATEAEVEIYTSDLVATLDRAAYDRFIATDLEHAWILRQHLWAIDPDRVDNILQLIVIANSLDRLTSELLLEWQVDELLETVSIGSISDRLLDDTIASLLKQELYTDLSLNIINNCLFLTTELRNSIAARVVGAAFEIFFQKNTGLFPVKLAEICQELIPDDLNIIQILIGLYTGVQLHSKAIALSEYYCQIVTSQSQRVFSSYLLQKSYLTSGNWENYLDRLTQHRQLVQDLIAATSDSLKHEPYKHQLIVASFFSFYTSDNPHIDRPLQNQLSAIYQDSLNSVIINSEFEPPSFEKKAGTIRIGYLASTLKLHSVGWLSRWLFHYHDRASEPQGGRESFQIFTYCLNQNSQDEFNHKWFRDKVDVSYYFNHYQEAVAQIKADEIDILIDLDSLTFDLSCQVMASKPAPVQVTWLGLDASGIPAIDYFIVDPYVLPDNAQDYYQEKLWRLPSTYLAIDGFEVGIPNLNRQNLDIPTDAVVYFSSQGGYKRHPDNIRCQMRIIAGVPNSYLLIKGKSDPEMIRNLFGKIGEEEGVSLDRLRFLPSVLDEETHRANLAIADVVLDTFPYNGATTTLETLWMGIPLVTQVGQQFAARNSYTFMLNAGIEEGIAWNEQEYVEWGIKLGLDRQLRDKIHGKLRSNRATAPVWNAKQFTLDMEQAYREMWAKYQEQQQQDLN
jgi:predicted O-linked N-acetylglucosamine transferase (SPINDLY family)